MCSGRHTLEVLQHPLSWPRIGRWHHQVLRSLFACVELCMGDAADQTAAVNRRLLCASVPSYFSEHPANPPIWITASSNLFNMKGLGHRDCISFHMHSHVKTKLIRNKILWCNLDKHSERLIIHMEMTDPGKNCTAFELQSLFSPLVTSCLPRPGESIDLGFLCKRLLLVLKTIQGDSVSAVIRLIRLLFSLRSSSPEQNYLNTKLRPEIL